METIEVVAAVIKGRKGFFATQRGYGDYKDGWEFPGGKVEVGETPEEALRREIREELKTEIQVDSFLCTVDYDYPKFHLTMHCYLCSVMSGELTLTEHEAARWLSKDELWSVDWLPADVEVVKSLEKHFPAKEGKDKNAVKARLVILLKMFYEMTDEEHPMTGIEILDYLREHDAPANEKTLRGDIQLLQDLGLDIVKVVSRPNYYFWGDRQFEMPELKLLIDAVASSRFITEKKSKELAKKLAGLASENQRRELRRHEYATNRVKSQNEKIYYTVNTINEAISKRRKISFQYTEYSAELQEVYRHDGELYYLSPYALLWNEDFYYVVGWSDKREKVSVFRVDRIDHPEMLEEKAVKRPDGFKLEDYSKPIFDMFEGKERVEVKLEVRNDLAKYIVDRFGTKLKTEKINDERFAVTVEVSLSPTFYAWVFQFGGGMRILAPEKAVDDILEMANTLIKRETL